MTLDTLLKKVRNCTLCSAHFPHRPNPVLWVSRTARVLIIGQAPGSRVHETGIPWNDRSGDRLREWLGWDKESFYDGSRIGLMGMGFCYPGVDKHGGDKPPRPECAPLWHTQLRALMKEVRVILLVGRYAHQYYLQGRNRESLAATVAAWKSFLPEFVPLPHPSWRNTAWLRKNPWFEQEMLPKLRRHLKNIL